MIEAIIFGNILIAMLINLIIIPGLGKNLFLFDKNNFIFKLWFRQYKIYFHNIYLLSVKNKLLNYSFNKTMTTLLAPYDFLFQKDIFRVRLYVQAGWYIMQQSKSVYLNFFFNFIV